MNLLLHKSKEEIPMSDTEAVSPQTDDLKGTICTEPTIDVDDVVIVENPREDYGDAEEMISSIIEHHGVQQAIKIRPARKDGKAELVFGHRRVKFCKEAVQRLIKIGNAKLADEIRKIPYTTFYGDKEHEYVLKIIENDKNKHLNPVEEGKAYQKYMASFKKSIDNLTQMISKDKMYIQKRLEILKLPDFAQDALIKNKIRLGHALALARLSNEKEIKQKLNQIIQQKMSVEGAINALRNYDCNLAKALFEKTECKECKFNGSTQGQLFETGTTLNGNCLNATCFSKKLREHIAKLKQEYKENGVKILSEAEHEALRRYEHISEWNKPAKNLYKTKCQKGCEKYAVYFENRCSDISIEEICLNPLCFKGYNPKDEDSKEREQRIKAKMQDRLKYNAFEYKREFLISKSEELIKPSTKEAKAFILHALIYKYDIRDPESLIAEVLKELGISKNYDDIFAAIMKQDEASIDKLITKVATLHLSEISPGELSKASECFGVSMQKHFVITEDYLSFHTKQQLIDLAKEIGLHEYLIDKGKAEWFNGKKPDLISCFFKEGFNLQGKVPKVILKKEA
jgi:ParB/RepB/Spo0J family partition protein